MSMLRGVGLVAFGARSHSLHKATFTGILKVKSLADRCCRGRRTRKKCKHIWKSSSHPEWEMKLRDSQEHEHKACYPAIATRDAATEVRKTKSIARCKNQTYFRIYEIGHV